MTDVVDKIEVTGAVRSIQVLHTAMSDVQGFTMGYRECFTQMCFALPE